MKTRIVFQVSMLAALAGCAAPDTSNTPKNRDQLERMKAEAKDYQNKDGSIDPAYAVDEFLNGSGKRSNKPVFDQPIGNRNPR